MNFEESLSRLEKITDELEKGDLSLDRSLKIFEEGIRLSRFCEKKLTDVEQRLEILKSSDLDIVDEIKDESESNEVNQEEIDDSKEENDNSFLF